MRRFRDRGNEKLLKQRDPIFFTALYFRHFFEASLERHTVPPARYRYGRVLAVVPAHVRASLVSFKPKLTSKQKRSHLPRCTLNGPACGHFLRGAVAVLYPSVAFDKDPSCSFQPPSLVGGRPTCLIWRRCPFLVTSYSNVTTESCRRVVVIHIIYREAHKRTSKVARKNPLLELLFSLSVSLICNLSTACTRTIAFYKTRALFVVVDLRPHGDWHDACIRRASTTVLALPRLWTRY